jgi:nucleotide-binding universal stress UspA family protein
MGFQNILVPYNGSVGAKKGFLAALELASNTKGKITIITCIENKSLLSFLKIKDSKKEFEMEKRLVEKEFNRLKKQTAKLKIPFKYVILKSTFAADTISEYVKSQDIDTVVLGKSPLRKTERQYHESMANYLSSRIECSMVIVK